MSGGLSTATLTERIAKVQARIADAAIRAGRLPEEVTLVAVSKTVDRATIDEAYAAGLRHFGENRVQEALRKFQEHLPADTTLSMVGQLQSNKAGLAVRLFDMVESVDRPSLVEALDRHSGNSRKVMPVLLQVNVAGEPQKAGCSIADACDLARNIASRPSLRLEGLMTMAPMFEDPENTRPVFRILCSLRERLHNELPEVHLDTLSMGMTNDFEVAIEEGATRVRIGRAIFG
jgi:pyridoxal phosphate enzyme (YggS family)